MARFQVGDIIAHPLERLAYYYRVEECFDEEPDILISSAGTAAAGLAEVFAKGAVIGRYESAYFTLIQPAKATCRADLEALYE